MTACEVWPGIWVGDLTAAHFWQGPKLAVRDQDGDYIFKHLGDRRLHFVYGKMTPEILQESAAWIDDFVAANVPVLIHCSGGLHRSAAVVAWWIHSRQKLDLEEAYAIMREHRPEIEPRINWIEGSARMID